MRRGTGFDLVVQSQKALRVLNKIWRTFSRPLVPRQRVTSVVPIRCGTGFDLAVFVSPFLGLCKDVWHYFPVIPFTNLFR